MVIEIHTKTSFTEPNISQDDGLYIALISGLKIGSKTSNPLYLNLLIDFFGGHLGSSYVRFQNISQF
jgi:hypothetical protein